MYPQLSFKKLLHEMNYCVALKRFEKSHFSLNAMFQSVTPQSQSVLLFVGQLVNENKKALSIRIGKTATVNTNSFNMLWNGKWESI